MVEITSLEQAKALHERLFTPPSDIDNKAKEIAEKTMNVRGGAGVRSYSEGDYWLHFGNSDQSTYFCNIDGPTPSGLSSSYEAICEAALGHLRKKNEFLEEAVLYFEQA